MNIGLAIKELRKMMGLNQQELAKKAGITAEALSDIERNKSFPPKRTIDALCRAIGIPVSYLMFYCITEEDVPAEKREFFKYISKPIKEFLFDCKKNDLQP